MAAFVSSAGIYHFAFGFLFIKLVTSHLRFSETNPQYFELFDLFVCSSSARILHHIPAVEGWPTVFSHATLLLDDAVTAFELALH